MNKDYHSGESICLADGYWCPFRWLDDTDAHDKW